MGLNPNTPLMLCGLLICWSPGNGLRAQTPTPVAPPKAPAALPPLPGKSSSPIDYFRQLLSATPAEREKLLGGKTPEHRKVLENSLLSYQALTPDERELRLRTMELRFHLTSLLRVPPASRAERLKSIPERDRPLVEDRLKVWDTFSESDQKVLLENERMRRVLSSVAAAAPRAETNLTGQTSNQLRRLEFELIRWQGVPESRREQVQRSFTNLFELSNAEKVREGLQPATLDETERAQMEKTVEHFKKLSPIQRSQCIRAFDQLAALSPAERRQFLVNAEEWQKMKPEDRAAWRKIVSRVPPLPPLPSGFRQPPLPPGITRKPALADTNR